MWTNRLSSLRLCPSSSHSAGSRLAGSALRPGHRAVVAAQRCFAAPVSGEQAQATLRTIWRKPSLDRCAGMPTTLKVPTESMRARFQSAHHWSMQRLLGDRMSTTPPSAKHLFFSCGLIEGIFLSINLMTMSPLIFEMVMPYHLKYTGLIVCWWGGTYLGLNIARYGPLSNGFWYAARYAAGPIAMVLGVMGLALADGVPGMPKLGPWPSYWLLLSSFGGMAIFDYALDRKQMIPPWLLRWKLGISGLIVASLLLGVVKGQYLEYNARDLIMAEAMALDDD